MADCDSVKMECIWSGDPRVRVLLRGQSLPAEGERIRLSRFVYCLYTESRYLLFHTLTRQLLSMPPQLIDYFADRRLLPPDVLAQEAPAKLYENHFLVPEGTQESQIYLELMDVLRLKEELPRGITQYVILPTSTCNARCFYCFEQGMQYRKMSAETVEDTLRFILRHKPKEQKRIHIHWFGGEPMCAADNIDRICAGLNEAGIEYDAEMTSNGSLFTAESAQRAFQVWKVNEIQITLDGMADEYAQRKQYTSAVKMPFETVIRNMHLLLAAGIKISVRLNVDENNLGEAFRVVDFLLREFTEEERTKMRAYAHSIFGQIGDVLNVCPVYTGTDALEMHVEEINDYIRRRWQMSLDLDAVFRLKTHYCMVTAPECNVLIDAAGQLFACDAMPEYMRYGSVKTDIDPDAWKRVIAPCTVRKECAECVFLPQCTEFDRCPSRTAYDQCFRQEQRRMDRDLRAIYTFYCEQQNHKQRDAKKAAGQEA